ncbi:MAG: multidrug ABC transporter ATP-binding protein, partial [Mangrovicoccus sp.]|nr:multidrug ABC transporter ATP-binding protein [Mangrovicoccus sp.]
IEEAEAIADRIAVINQGRILLVEEKDALMKRMGRKEMRVELAHPIKTLPESLGKYDLRLTDGGNALCYGYDIAGQGTGITALLSDLAAAGLQMKDLSTRQNTLEDIFVDLVREGADSKGDAA